MDDGELGFAFGEHNRMSEASVLGSPVADYGYNGRGERVKKFVQGTTVFLYGPGGELLAESGATLREHVYLEGVPLAVIVDDTDLYHVHTDHLGTPKKLTDGNGLVVWDAVYEPFGETTLETELVAYHLRFPGQYFDAETGLHYNYFRNYDPDTGRYIESDPIGLDGSLNTYAYVLGNPVRFTDPTGQFLPVLAAIPALTD